MTKRIKLDTHDIFYSEQCHGSAGIFRELYFQVDSKEEADQLIQQILDEHRFYNKFHDKPVALIDPKELKLLKEKTEKWNKLELEWKDKTDQIWELGQDNNLLKEALITVRDLLVKNKHAEVEHDIQYILTVDPKIKKILADNNEEEGEKPE